MFLKGIENLLSNKYNVAQVCVVEIESSFYWRTLYKYLISYSLAGAVFYTLLTT